MKRKFIVNPKSGKGMAGREFGRLREFFGNRKADFDYVVGESRADIIEQVRRAIHDSCDQIVAVGGDGTVNAVLNGFYENGTPIRPAAAFAVARLGTGCDYYRSIVRGSRVKDWREIVLNHRVERVDIGEIAFSGGKRPTQYFINLASVGMSAVIVREKENLPPWVPKSLCYIVPTLQQLRRYQATPARITLDGKTLDIELNAALIAKGLYGGGGMKWGAAVSLDDGEFDVTVFEKMTPAEMFRKLPRLYTGSFDNVQGVHKFKARKIAVEAPAPIPMEFDGELGGTTDFEIRLKERAVPVCFPK